MEGELSVRELYNMICRSDLWDYLSWGLLHKSEWTTEPQPGMTLAVRIVNVDLANRRFSLRLA